MQKRLEHRLFVFTMIVTKAVFIQVMLKILRAHVVVDAPDAVFDVAPEAVDSLSMNITRNIDFLCVQDSLVGITHALKFVIGGEFVGMDGCALLNGFDNNGQNCLALNIRNNHSLDSPQTLHNANHRHFILGAASSLAGVMFAAKIRFICFYVALKRIAAVFIKARANEPEHTPCSLISDTRFSLNLLCGDAATGRGHEIDSIKPGGESSSGFVKDCLRSRMDMITAFLTAKRAARTHEVMFRDFPANFATNAPRPPIAFEPEKTSGIIGEFLAKIIDGVFLHVFFAIFHLP
jgi:hypothetical protein